MNYREKYFTCAAAAALLCHAAATGTKPNETVECCNLGDCVLRPAEEGCPSGFDEPPPPDPRPGDPLAPPTEAQIRAAEALLRDPRVKDVFTAEVLAAAPFIDIDTNGNGVAAERIRTGCRLRVFDVYMGEIQSMDEIEALFEGGCIAPDHCLIVSHHPRCVAGDVGIFAFGVNELNESYPRRSKSLITAGDRWNEATAVRAVAVAAVRIHDGGAQ